MPLVYQKKQKNLNKIKDLITGYIINQRKAITNKEITRKETTSINVYKEGKLFEIWTFKLSKILNADSQYEKSYKIIMQSIYSYIKQNEIKSVVEMEIIDTSNQQTSFKELAIKNEKKFKKLKISSDETLEIKVRTLFDSTSKAVLTTPTKILRTKTDNNKYRKIQSESTKSKHNREINRKEGVGFYEHMIFCNRLFNRNKSSLKGFKATVNIKNSKQTKYEIKELDVWFTESIGNGDIHPYYIVNIKNICLKINSSNKLLNNNKEKGEIQIIIKSPNGKPVDWIAIEYELKNSPVMIIKVTKRNYYNKKANKPQHRIKNMGYVYVDSIKDSNAKDSPSFYFIKHIKYMFTNDMCFKLDDEVYTSETIVENVGV